MRVNYLDVIFISDIDRVINVEVVISYFRVEIKFLLEVIIYVKSNWMDFCIIVGLCLVGVILLFDGLIEDLL